MIAALGVPAAIRAAASKAPDPLVVELVLLDCESGCGKSASVTAGLTPALQPPDGLVPVVIRDRGDDWVRGPLSASLDALFHGLSESERGRLGWAASPDLAAISRGCRWSSTRGSGPSPIRSGDGRC